MAKIFLHPGESYADTLPTYEVAVEETGGPCAPLPKLSCERLCGPRSWTFPRKASFGLSDRLWIRRSLPKLKVRWPVTAHQPYHWQPAPDPRHPHGGGAKPGTAVFRGRRLLVVDHADLLDMHYSGDCLVPAGNWAVYLGQEGMGTKPHLHPRIGQCFPPRLCYLGFLFYMCISLLNLHHLCTPLMLFLTAMRQYLPPWATPWPSDSHDISSPYTIPK